MQFGCQLQELLLGVPFAVFLDVLVLLLPVVVPAVLLCALLLLVGLIASTL